jgi:cell division protein FtsL
MVRWDRLGRVAMLCVMAALLYLYLSAGVTLFHTWRESRSTDAQVQTLERQHRQLQAQHTALSASGTVEAEARQLGMMFPTEHTFIVRGLPND